MDGWMDGKWMVGLDGWMGWVEDRWLVGQMDGWKNRWLDGWMEDGWERKRDEVEFYLGPARPPQ